MAARKKQDWTTVDLAPIGAEGVRRLEAPHLGSVFQPIVDLATGKTFAHEALVRCSDPDYPTPQALFEHAVRENACGRLGRLIREALFAASGDIALFVNLHPQELSSHWLVQPDDPIGFHAKPVFLEITEAAAFTHFDLCRSVLRELCRRTGARLVVDDFGAGYSNLERVADLQPSVVKLDLALTRDVHRNTPRQIVVRHMVRMCHELGARVVAEGVEQAEELSCVRDLGVDLGQGYLLGRPAAPPRPALWPAVERRAPPGPPQSKPGSSRKPSSRR